jgi:hypothetical protein
LVDIHLNKSASTSVALYDQRGKLVKNLLAKNLPIGDHQLKLQTSELSSGVYFLKARADGITKTISLIIQHN